MADPANTTGTPVPPVTPPTGAADDPGQTTGEPAATPPAKPLFTANSQAELDAKFGETRTEGRLSVAKSYGFDTIAAFDTAAKGWKTAHEASLTDAQKAQAAEAALKAENASLRAVVSDASMKTESARIAVALGIDPAKMDRVNQYRVKGEGEIGADGNVNPMLLEHSLTTFIANNPEFKAAPTTVGVTGSTPASAAGDPASLDERINTATKEGKFQEAIELQMQKMFQPLAV